MASLNKQALQRYYIIDRMIRSHRFPSMNDLIDRCEEEIGTLFSKETIQKDIQTMKYDRLLNFNAPIYYNRFHKGYEYLDENFKIDKVNLTDDEYNALENVKDIVKQLKGTRLNSRFNSAMKKISSGINDSQVPVINFHHVNYYSDKWDLDDFISLVKNQIPIKVHYKIQDGISKEILHPYMLKESFTKWTLISYSEEQNLVSSYDLSKFRKIEKLENHKFIKNNYELSTYTGNTIISNEKKNFNYTVLLKFNKSYHKEITTFPVSKEQKIVKFYKNGDFLLRLKPEVNMELIEWILSLNTNVKVMKPDWLSILVSFIILEMYEKYF